jgi:hypothetical protein
VIVRLASKLPDNYNNAAFSEVLKLRPLVLLITVITRNEYEALVK